ncbi:MAG: stage V sporulation protein AD [Clostridia bacterium]|nr:stage V sporulation protein AD [Clostridia bacterium]
MSTLIFKNRPRIIGWYSVAGKKESEGPLGTTFSRVVKDEYFGEKTHEGAERKLFETAIQGAIQVAKVQPDIVFAGDLLNQIVSSSFAMRDIGLPYAGVYGACSTMALSLLVAATFVDAGVVQTTVAAAGSHFATAERQYRTPLEFGNQRPPCSQWTVTGAGATVLSADSKKSRLAITAGTIGRVVDYGVKDVNNMGAAMAPAAADTLARHFKNTNTKPADYDAIFSGDLGQIGEEALRDLLKDKGYELGENYHDCGKLIYSVDQKVDMGGSGCGCSAVTLNGYIMDKFQSGEYHKVIFMATGALLSPTTCFQGESIPGIANAVVIEEVTE